MHGSQTTFSATVLSQYYVFLLCCRIDQHGVVKAADFGLTEDMYARKYFRRNKSEEGSEAKVPIRWMAPESIENNIYNEKTDVVGLSKLCATTIHSAR